MNFGSISNLNNLRAGDLPPFNPRSLPGNTLLLDSSTATVYDDGAIQFTASDKAYLSIADNASLSMGAGVDFTIAGWIYLDTLGSTKIILRKGLANATASALEYAILQDSNNKINVLVSDGTTIYTAIHGTTISTSTWYFFEMLVNTTAHTLTVNLNRGTAVTTNSITYAANGTDNLFVGNNLAGTAGWGGRMDSFGMWKRVLTSTELDFLYNAGAGRMYSDLMTAHKVSMVSWWGFNEEDGIRYDAFGTNHLTPTFANIIDNTSTLGTELVTNGTFTTDTTGWTGTNATLASVAGGQAGNCLEVTDSGSGGGYGYQSITTVANQNYTLSYYFKKGSGASGALGVCVTAGCKTLYDSGTLTDANWTLKTFNFKATGTTTIISTFSNGASGTALFDGITLKALTQTNLNGGFESLGTGETLGSELLSNPGFETAGTNGGTISGTKTSTRARASNVATIVTGTPHGLSSTNVVTIAGMTDTTFNATNVAVTVSDATTFTYANTGSDVGSGSDTGGTITTDVFANWSTTVSLGGLVSLDTSVKHAGNNSVKCTTASASSDQKVFQSITTSASTRYKLTFWTYGDGTNAGNYAVYDNSNAAYLVAVTTTGVTAGAWTQVTMYFTTVAGGISTQLIFYGKSVTGAVAYFDDISVKQVTASNTFLNWVEVIGGSSTVTADTATPYAGTNSAKITLDAASSFTSLYQNVITANHKYKATVYAKSASAGAYGRVDFGIAAAAINTLTLTTSYALYTIYGTATDATFRLTRAGTPGAIALTYDDVTLSCTEIPSAAGIAAGLAIDGNLGASFNGTTQYLSKTNDAKLQTGDIDFTVWGWVNLASKQSQVANVIAAKWTGSGDLREWYLAYLGTGTDRFSFSISTNGTSPGVTTLLDTKIGSPAINTWYFIVAWHDSVANRIYLQINDGTADLSAHADGATALASPFTVGAIGGPSSFINARIDGVGFIKRTLTASEKTALFNAGKGVKYAGLPSTISADSTLVFWNLDMYSAGTAPVTRLDSTANAMNLTDTGNTPSGQGVNYYEGTASKWLDQSASANNFIQTTQSSRLLYVTNAQNGKPVLRGDGLTKSLFNANDLIGTGNVTVFAVIKPRGLGGSNAGRIIDNGKLIIFTGTYVGAISDGSTLTQSAGSSITLGTAYVIIITRTSAGVVNFYINGAASGTANQASGTPAAGSPTYIGNNVAGTRGFDGDLDEVGIYTSILTTTQIANLTRFLRTRWGV